MASLDLILQALSLIAAIKKKDPSVTAAVKVAAKDEDQDVKIAALETRMAALEEKNATLLRVVELMAKARKASA